MPHVPGPEKWVPVRIDASLFTAYVVVKGLQIYGLSDPDRIYYYATRGRAQAAANKLNKEEEK